MIKVRIAPSPTGPLHIGTVRTALFNFLFAKKHGGKFILRFEDTDRSRSTKEYEKDIIEGLKWLGLDWDEEICYQMKRLAIYQKYLEKLLKEGKVYKCFCAEEELKKEREEQRKKGLAPRYSGKCQTLSDEEIKKREAAGQKPAYRFNIPLKEKIAFNDLIHGDVEFDTGLFGDFIIVRADGIPIFLLSNVVDDYEMKITHVIRGDDHLSNTPKQILLARALGFKIPQYGHIPMILNPDKTKMSKRRDPVSITHDFRDKGYLPEAMINFLSLLGWNPKDNREYFTLSELIKEFDLEEVHRSGAIFNVEKLDSTNAYYIKKKSDDEIYDWIGKDKLFEAKDKEFVKRIVHVLRDRVKRLNEFSEFSQYFFKEPEYEKEILIFKKSDPTKTKKGLFASAESIEKASEKVLSSVDELNKLLSDVVRESGLENGDVFWPIRVALSGLSASPSPAELIWVLGKEKSLKRIKRVIDKLT